MEIHLELVEDMLGIRQVLVKHFQFREMVVMDILVCRLRDSEDSLLLDVEDILLPDVDDILQVMD